jgi:hypothetical protein
MVIQTPYPMQDGARLNRRHGFLSTDMVVAMAILMLALAPLALSFLHEKRMARACYERAIAMEIVDGEKEILAAGAWKRFGIGTHAYEVRAASAANLPPGRFELTITTNRLRLTWRPESAKERVVTVVREAVLR